MAQKPVERKHAVLEVVVELKELAEEHRWPELAAYVITQTGRFQRKPLCLEYGI
jgi:hypothetical protein